MTRATRRALAPASPATHLTIEAVQSISDYGIIGDGRAAALVSRSASIDWLCWPRFDSPSLFGAILDDTAGRWRIAPTTPFAAERRYLPDTNILETTFRTDTGAVTVIDLMPVADEAAKCAALTPDHELLRVVECRAGDVEVEMLLQPRPDYARSRVRFRAAGKLGLRMQTSVGLLTLHTDLTLEPVSDGIVRGRTRLRAGESLHFSLTLAHDWPAVIPPLGERTRAAIARSAAWWRSWAAALTYQGPVRDAVVRSALALKLLVHSPSGAVVAAPTTSLPERPGGDLNWDYRFCWLRDASLTVRALLGLGFREEARGFASWLLHSTSLTRPSLRVLYDVYGRAPRAEAILDNLRGFAGSRPVRIGNAAADQLQLDIHGEVVDATALLARGSARLDGDTRRMLRGLGEYVCRNWRRPDEGIWEPRSGRRHNTHSRLLCWVALDRLLELRDRGLLTQGPFATFDRERALIAAELRARAWSPKRDSYVATMDGDELDASLLLMAWYGFEDAASERMQKTYARIREELGAPGGLLYRYRTGESPDEGAFGVCGFWAAEYLALGGGSLEEARALFHTLCGHANDLGLFAEEIAPDTGEALGNFPQAFTHVGLINAAITLARRERHEAERAQPGRAAVGS